MTLSHCGLFPFISSGICMFACVGAHVCTCVWTSEVDVMRQDLFLTPEFTNSVGCYPVCPEDLHLPFPSAGIRGRLPQLPSLYMGALIQTPFLGSACQVFTYWPLLGFQCVPPQHEVRFTVPSFDSGCLWRANPSKPAVAHLWDILQLFFPSIWCSTTETWLWWLG